MGLEPGQLLPWVATSYRCAKSEAIIPSLLSSLRSRAGSERELWISGWAARRSKARAQDDKRARGCGRRTSDQSHESKRGTHLADKSAVGTINRPLLAAGQEF